MWSKYVTYDTLTQCKDFSNLRRRPTECKGRMGEEQEKVEGNMGPIQDILPFGWTCLVSEMCAHVDGGQQAQALGNPRV